MNNIKKTIQFLFILLLGLCTAQTYPLNTSPSDIPYGAYLKDLDGKLDKYVGLWKGNWNGKTLYIEFKKIKTYSDIGVHHYYKDRILGERKIINSNNEVEIDRITNFDIQYPEISGPSIDLRYLGKKRFSFYPKNMCGKHVTLHITDFDEANHIMTLRFEYMPSYNLDESCEHYDYVQQYDDFPINFPREDITLTKQ